MISYRQREEAYAHSALGKHLDIVDFGKVWLFLFQGATGNPPRYGLKAIFAEAILRWSPQKLQDMS
ncbi:MAG: hypothetical protein CSA35_00195 [Dethiosulfovibrio peptidovorans]|nr:MAG: hypothetical protein CSA35_00195 [Dethiosulfovibrio peptidovorans]